MCIRNPQSFVGKSGFGWKEFVLDHGDLISELYGGKPLRMGVWYKSRSGPGFHIFTSFRSAKAWGKGDDCRYLLAKVEYQNSIAKGCQCFDGEFLPTITAEKMKIVETYHIGSRKPLTKSQFRNLKRKSRAQVLCTIR